MAKKLTDGELILKRRARRRLIGVVALTTVVVVLLPMVLDREPKPVGQDIELRIPDKDKVGGFESQVGAPAAHVPAAAVAQAPAAVSTLPADQPAANPVAVAPPASPQPSSAVEKSVVPKPEHKTSSVPVETKSAATGHTPPVQPEAATGFVVQVGAFSVAETAHRWQRNLLNQGIKAYTEKAGDKVRVRAGPYSTREAADKVRHRLELQGLKPVVSPAS
ncbi:MAG: SPOR domain-containing protein [Pseudomonadota bacterium]